MSSVFSFSASDCQSAGESKLSAFSRFVNGFIGVRGSLGHWYNICQSKVVDALLAGKLERAIGTGIA
jgi:hypothetical protein